MLDILLVTASLLLAPQQATTKPGTPPTAAETMLHADVVKLLEISETRDRLQAGIPSMVEQGRKAMMDKCSTCTPEFGEEWAKRMAARLNVQDFVDATIQAYEKDLTDTDIKELIAFQEQRKIDPSAAPSAELKKKLTAVMPDLMADITAGCVRVGAKLGGEIGAAIEKEHPEWTKGASNPQAPQ